MNPIDEQVKELLVLEDRLKKLKSEALRVFRPFPASVPFFTSKAPQRIILGGNQSSKSTSALCYVCAQLLRRPILGPTGHVLLAPENSKHNITWWLIGYGGKHISNTFYPKIFKPGLFWIIDDPVTGDPRLWNPNDPYDVEHEDEKRASEPLIPEYEIDSIAWENKGDNEPSRVKLKNGNEIVFMSSTAQLVQGATLNGGILIDEDVAFPDYVNDWIARLALQRGKFVWAAFPWGNNDALQNLILAAEKMAHLPKPTIQKFQLTFSGNPFVPRDQRDATLAAWAAQGNAVLRARDLGEFDGSGVKMYFDYNVSGHLLSRELIPEDEWDSRHPVDRIMLERDGNPPDDWMLCLALDPGSAKAGVGFYAVPPPELGDFVVLYDEIFQERSDADKLADEVVKRTMGRQFQRFFIDNHAARRTPEGFGKTIRSVYVDAFEKRGIRCQVTGSNFLNGTDNVEVRCQQVRSALKPREQPLENGNVMFVPKIRVWAPKCQRWIWEIERYKRKIVKDESQDVPIAVNCEMMQCMEYYVGSETEYVPPAPRRRRTVKELWARLDILMGKEPKQATQTVTL